MISDIFLLPVLSLVVDRVRLAPERHVGLLQGLFPGEPEIGKEVGIIGNRAQIGALVLPLAPREPAVEELQP
ncbi:hypothetical protein [Bradyrhizobium arachidis]|uniref:hypothetical protein n=1 Tax=Bradyrhizobium arachidis TaxID=858423 RepID=UPI0021635CF9|nr:hypothetical protein [Bradyrhizobium arachidis]UVO29702.1 hypothetical protein KUF59_02715 [Bradyrhizobium arachidis]